MKSRRFCNEVTFVKRAVRVPSLKYRLVTVNYCNRYFYNGRFLFLQLEIEQCFVLSFISSIQVKVLGPKR